jgi:hypothetical protein
VARHRNPNLHTVSKSRTGRVKVLDFGLAKAMFQRDGGWAVRDAERASTVARLVHARFKSANLADQSPSRLPTPNESVTRVTPVTCVTTVTAATAVTLPVFYIT